MRANLKTNAPAPLGVYCCGTVSAAGLAIAAGDKIP